MLLEAKEILFSCRHRRAAQGLPWREPRARIFSVLPCHLCERTGSFGSSFSSLLASPAAFLPSPLLPTPQFERNNNICEPYRPVRRREATVCFSSCSPYAELLHCRGALRFFWWSFSHFSSPSTSPPQDARYTGALLRNPDSIPTLVACLRDASYSDFIPDGPVSGSHSARP